MSERRRRSRYLPSSARNKTARPAGRVILLSTVSIMYLDSHSNMIYTVNMKELSSDLLRGHTDTIILGLLSEDDRYGYEITKLIFERSGRKYELKEATMYSSLKRLERDGCIGSYWGDETQGGRRRYYHITASGRELYKVNKQNWNWAKKILDKLL